MKKFFVISLVFLLVFGMVGVVVARSGGLTSVIALIGGNVEMEAVSPFEVSGWGGVTFDFKEGKTNAVFPGQRIAEGEVRVRNISPYAYGVDFYVTPIEVMGDKWPSFDVVVTKTGEKIYPGQFILQPGEEVILEVFVDVSYHSSKVIFTGLELIISPTRHHLMA